MEISPTEYLKPKIVDVDIKSPNRAKVTQNRWKEVLAIH